MSWFETKTRVRFCEVDEYGFAWHGHFAKWLEIARVEMMRECEITPKQLIDAGYLVPLINMNIDFKKSIKNDSEIIVRAKIIKPEKAALVFEYEIISEDNKILYATASTTHVLMKTDETLIYFLPKDLNEKINKLAEKYSDQ